MFSVDILLLYDEKSVVALDEELSMESFLVGDETCGKFGLLRSSLEPMKLVLSFSAMSATNQSIKSPGSLSILTPSQFKSPSWPPAGECAPFIWSLNKSGKLSKISWGDSSGSSSDPQEYRGGDGLLKVRDWVVCPSEGKVSCVLDAGESVSMLLGGGSLSTLPDARGVWSPCGVDGLGEICMLLLIIAGCRVWSLNKSRKLSNISCCDSLGSSIDP